MTSISHSQTMTNYNVEMLTFIHELLRNEVVSLLCKRGRASDAEYVKIINLLKKASELLDDKK